MTESNGPNVPPPLTPLTPATLEPEPVLVAEPEGVAFHEHVASGRDRSTATRVGIITGSALLVLVGVAAAMGASPSPATNPTSGVGADPSAAPAATADPSANPNGTRPDGGGLFGMPGMGFRGGFPGVGIGFHDITITTIDGSSISLKTDDGWTRTITVTDTTSITKGGATIAIGDLAVGDQVALRQDRASDGTYTVTGIVVVLPTVAGQISAIDGNTITITEAGGTKATIHVDSSTTYQVAGGTGSLSDLKVGTVIFAEGTQRADGSLDADAIRGGFDMDGMGPGFQAKPGFPDGLGGHDDQDPNATAAPSSSAS